MSLFWREYAAMLADVTMEHYDRVMDIDLRGVLLGTKHAIRTMLESGRGGAIVNWSSIGGLNASPFTGVYSAAMAGVISVTRTAAVEYADKEILCGITNLILKPAEYSQI